MCNKDLCRSTLTADVSTDMSAESRSTCRPTPSDTSLLVVFDLFRLLVAFDLFHTS